MDGASTRLYFCVAIALLAHAGLLAWATSAPSENAEGATLMQATRAAAQTAAPTETTVRSARDQQGTDARTRAAVQAGAPAITQPGAERATRFVVVREPAPTPEPTPAAISDPAEQARRERVRAAIRDARADYLARWQQRIESLGSRRYASDLLASDRPRRLTMAVRVAADGHLREVRLLRSSGNPALDDTALAIVRAAAPYARFDATLAGAAQEIAFVYDWLFEPDGATEIEPGA